MAYVLASALGGKPTSVNSTGDAPYINWMAFGNGGSSSTTTLSYRSQEFSQHMMNYPITSQFNIVFKNVSTTGSYYSVCSGQKVDPNDANSVTIPENTSKVNFKVEMSHDDYETMQQQSDPTVSTIPKQIVLLMLIVSLLLLLMKLDFLQV